MTELFKNLTTQLADLIEAAAAIIVAFAAAEATVRALGLFVRPKLPPEAKEEVRLRLGRWLSLALEFELAADILRTAIAPTWNDVGLLAAIIGLRTILNYFLQMDIDRVTARWHASQPRQAGLSAEAAPASVPVRETVARLE